MAKKAFIIGINTLGLKYCVNDAILMADCLEQHGYDVVIIKASSEKRTILDHFEEVVDNCDKTDTLIFYFSGHGVLRKGKLDLLLADDTTARSSRISINDIADAFEDCVAGQKLLILDCCHAGASHAEWIPDPADAYRLLTASERLEKSKEFDALSASFLTYHIHQALTTCQTELLINDSVIRVDAVYTWLKHAAERHNGIPDSIKVPVPNLLGNAKANFEIAAISVTDIKADNRTEQLLFEQKAEARYRALALESCDIVDLANLPESDRHLATRHLELRRLYVSLRIKVEISSDIEADDEELDAIEKRREKILWSRTISDMRKEEADRVSIGERLAQAHRLVVLGDPGAGKTTVLRWLATAYLLRLKDDKDWQALPDVQTLPDEDWLPIIIRCRDLDRDCLNGSLDDMLHHTLRKSEMDEAETQTLRKVLRDKLNSGQALLLIDGLDEITDPAVRIRFCQQVEQMQIAYPSATIIVTSRIVGYREMGYRIKRGFEHVTIAELTKADKDDFARRWCTLTEIPERRRKAADELISDIHSNDRIEGLTGNPMLLTTMALVKRKVGKLPSRRIELYWEAVQVLLNWRREVDEPLDHYEAIPQLEYLAYAMCDRGVQQLREDEIVDLISRMRSEYPNIYAVHQHTPEEFLRLVERRTGILVEAGHARHIGRLIPVFEFRHLTFQEYLAGLALVEGRFPGRDKNRSLAEHVAILAGRTSEIEVSDGKKELAVTENWREALRLCVAACSDDDVNSVLEAILTSLPGEESAATTQPRIVLAISCLADEPNVSTVLAHTVLQKFASEINDSSLDNNSSSLLALQEIARSRWALPLRHYLIQRLDQPDANMNDMAAFASACVMYLFSTFNVAVPDNLDSISSETIKKTLTEQIAIFEVAKVIETVNTIFGLILCVNQKKIYVPELIDWLQRLPTADLINRRIAAGGLLALNQDDLGENVWRPSNDDLNKFIAFVENPASDVLVVLFLIRILGNERVAKAFTLLRRRLNDQHVFVRESAADALGNLGNAFAIEPLISKLTDHDKGVRESAALALGKLGGIQAVEPLIAILTDPEKVVRKAVVGSLGKLDDKRAVEPLIGMLVDPERDVRQAAISALGRLGESSAVAPLIDMLTNQEPQIHRSTILALGQLNALSAVDLLIDRLADPDRSIRSAAASALGRLGDAKSVEPLIEVLSDQEYDVRMAAVSALGQIGDLRAFEPLLICVKDNDRILRSAVIQAIKNISSKKIVDLLIIKLDHEDSNIRSATAQMLGHIGKRRRTVAPLLKLLDDEDVKVKASAIYALGRVGDWTISNQLINQLNSSDSSVCAAAITALGQFGNAEVVDLLIEKLEDQEPNVQSAAAKALGQLGAPQAVEPLLARLKDSNIYARDSAIQALGKLKDGRSLESLLTILNNQDDWALDSAARALGSIGDYQAIEPLLAIVDHEKSWVRSAAVQALGQIGDARAIEPIVAKLEDEARWVRETAAQALEQIGNHDAIDLLIEKLDGGHNGARSATAYALGLLGETRAVEPLLDKLHDRDDAVRSSSVEALGRIGEPSTVESIAAMLKDRAKEVQSAAALALGRIGGDQAEEILRELLMDEEQQTRQNALGGLAMTCQEEIERKLLSRDLDASAPFIDPLEVIDDDQVDDVADQLNLDSKEIQQYYEVLADRFGLQLSWKL